MPMIDMGTTMDDLIAGAVFRSPYPFVRTTHTEFDGDGYSEVRTWKPGVEMEQVYIPPDDCDTECVAEGVGEIILTVVSVHKPGRYPTRVFFTRRWRDPGGKEFGKNACRVATVEKFRRLSRGYYHEYVIRPLAKKAA
jgi:hypothetical protein